MLKKKINPQEAITQYISEKDLDITLMELPQIDNKEIPLEDIKLCPIAYAELFLKLFSQFNADFSELPQASNLIDNNKIHYSSILQLLSFKSKKVHIGKERSINKLQQYLIDNNLEISKFFDMCVGIYIEQ